MNFYNLKSMNYIYSILFMILCFTLISCEHGKRSRKEISVNQKTCLTPEKKEVDWFVIFLFPINSNESKVLSYGYFDENSKSIEYYEYDSETFPGISLLEGYDDDETNYFFWNDDTTVENGEKSSSSSGKAHSKGGLIFNTEGGFLLSHSLPRFPRRAERNKIIDDFPSNAGVFGQTFICISLDKENSLKIVETLNIINPQMVMSVNEDRTQTPGNAEVLKLIKNRQDGKLPDFKISEVISRKGKAFQVFSKGRDQPNLPYDSYIPNHYKDSIFVQTWTKPDMEESICKETYKVINVQEVKFGEFAFDKNQEHSKWAVGAKKDLCCFGDLNRTSSQKKRGGNTICFLQLNLAKTMRTAITLRDSCTVNATFLSYLETDE